MWDMAKKQKQQAGEWRNRIVRTGTAPASEFKANELNWRVHPKAQRDALKGVLSEVGWVTGVITNVTTGNVIDGHARIEEALKLGDETPVPFVEVELSEAEEMKILATLDPLSAMAGADKEQLDALLREVETADAAVMQMLDDLAKANGLDYGKEGASDADAEPQIDKADELRVKWGVERGQVWQLGEHRLMCGDSTSAEDVARLMKGERFRAVTTSPPYTDQREYELKSFDWLALANGFFAALVPHIGKPADVLVNLGMSHKNGEVDRYWDVWLEECKRTGWPLYGWYVWDKGSGMPGEWNGRLAPAHEFIFHFNAGRKPAQKWIETTGESAKRGASGKRFRKKDGSLAEVTSPDKIGQPFKVPDSVVRIGREMARGIHTQAHPAVFSVEFASFLIQTWSEPGAIVYEPFSGSGTTIIACEQLGRKCRAMEISPAYAAVALQRWADATGKTPALLDS